VDSGNSQGSSLVSASLAPTISKKKNPRALTPGFFLVLVTSLGGSVSAKRAIIIVIMVAAFVTLSKVMSR
jgi:hypothetical protein